MGVIRLHREIGEPHKQTLFAALHSSADEETGPNKPHPALTCLIGLKRENGLVKWPELPVF